jgi:hypothetical protein
MAGTLSTAERADRHSRLVIWYSFRHERDGDGPFLPDGALLSASSLEAVAHGSPRWMRPAAVSAAAAFLLLSIVASTAEALESGWTSLRLAPAFALVRGYPMYSLSTQPPWVMVGYGPFYPLAYLPCTLARTTLPAVAIGVTLTHLFLLGPVALLCALFRARLGDPRRKAVEVAVFEGVLLFGALTYVVGSLAYIARSIHVDAPTYGLLLLACFAAQRAEPSVPQEAGKRWTLAAGALAALCFCCKMNALGSVGALGLYVWWSGGWRRALRFALAAAVTAAIVYAWAAHQSSAAAIVHNFRAVGRFPWYTAGALWRGSGIGAMSESSHALRDRLASAAFLGVHCVRTYGVPFLATALFAYALGRRWEGAAEAGERQATKATPPSAPPRPSASPARMIGCLLVVTLFGVPAAIASTAKYGGSINSWGFVSVPLTVATVLALVAVLERASRKQLLVTHGLLAAMLLLPAAKAAASAKTHPFRNNGMEEAFATIKAHPGECYFASDPLAHLLAGDRFRPNLDVVYSYAIAGLPLDPAAFKSAMPERFEYLVVGTQLEGWGLDELHRLLPEESEQTDRLHLRFHEAWTRPAGAATVE